ncbi:MAG: hypothetical protein HN411_05500 [Waddliaceae bacterium]|jgi:hypothetical protein|nr:hypothetical protein [Waddliaceae bacterium]MBT3579593.1 hypothetical protein [Waddliaceae bacterium]MBT4444577.1 hypothetical protein [Waddliaceae bacterium]MBT6929196.1 hypothetical protein [Waddliaceae bacterium]MBT7263971.1 hypothetical protein [Waddliaceae bacterium]
MTGAANGVMPNAFIRDDEIKRDNVLLLKSIVKEKATLTSIVATLATAKFAAMLFPPLASLTASLIITRYVVAKIDLSYSKVLKPAKRISFYLVEKAQIVMSLAYAAMIISVPSSYAVSSGIGVAIGATYATYKSMFNFVKDA